MRKEAEKLSEDEKWFQVSLRFMGNNLPVDEMEAELGISPTFTGKIGEHVNDNPRYGKHRSNLWGRSFTEDSTVPFEQQISDLLDILEPRKPALDELLSIPGVEGELFLGFRSGNGQGGAYFPSSLLARISRLGLALGLDLYP